MSDQADFSIFHFSFLIATKSTGCLVAVTELLVPNPLVDEKPVLVDAMTNEKFEMRNGKSSL